MRQLTLQIISGISGLWLAHQFITGVEFIGLWTTLLLAGLILGLINIFIKPILKFITTPLRLLTFGLFGLIINMGIIWIVDVFFDELIIKGIVPLFWTAILLWGLSTILYILFSKKAKTI